MSAQVDCTRDAAAARIKDGQSQLQLARLCGFEASAAELSGMHAKIRPAPSRLIQCLGEQIDLDRLRREMEKPVAKDIEATFGKSCPPPFGGLSWLTDCPSC